MKYDIIQTYILKYTRADFEHNNEHEKWESQQLEQSCIR